MCSFSNDWHWKVPAAPTDQTLTVPSVLPLASLVPSLFQSIEFTTRLCPVIVEKQVHVDRSHSLTVVSQEPVTRMLGSSGLKAREDTALLCPRRGRNISPFFASQRYMMLSLPPEARICAQGLQDTENTMSVCALIVEKQVYVARSHSLTVLSHEPETRMLGSSGLKARQDTARPSLASMCPDSDDLICPAAASTK